MEKFVEVVVLVVEVKFAELEAKFVEIVVVFVVLELELLKDGGVT